MQIIVFYTILGGLNNFLWKFNFVNYILNNTSLHKNFQSVYNIFLFTG